MDTGELSGLLKRLCKVCWAANVTNPITYVTQISYLLFLKMLEEWDAQAEQDARDLGRPRRSLFEGEYEALRWSRFSSDPDNDRMLRRDDPFGQVVVPDHKELDRGTLGAILRQAGISVDEFVKWL